MRSSSFILALTLTLGTYAHAAPRPGDSLLAGVSMNVAKWLDTPTPRNGLAQSVKLSGVPMAAAARHGASTQSVRTTPDQALSGIPMALAKRL